jgi:hypothetical protein
MSNHTQWCLMNGKRQARHSWEERREASGFKMPTKGTSPTCRPPESLLETSQPTHAQQDGLHRFLGNLLVMMGLEIQPHHRRPVQMAFSH